MRPAATTTPVVRRRAIASAIRPIAPAPTTSTRSLSPISATLIMSTATPQGSASMAAAGSSPGAGTALWAGAISASAKPMEGPPQKPGALLHRSTRPLRHSSHSPQNELDSSAMRSPTLMCFTLAPACRTTAAISWPNARDSFAR